MTRKITSEKLQEMLWGFASHRVLTVAGKVGILNALSGEGTTIDDLVLSLGLNPLAVEKIVHALCAMNVAQSEEDTYRITPELNGLFCGGDNDFTAFLVHAHYLYDSWGQNLERWLQGNEWSTHRRTPEETRSFGAAMRAMSGQIASRVVAALDLSGVQRILDVGGGTGGYAEVFCQASDSINAVVLDIDEVARVGQQRLDGSELSKRITFQGGNYMTAPLGEGYHMVLLANVLHQESPENAAVLIERSAGALASGGRLVIVDFAIDDKKQENLVGTLFAINMRSFGDTYPEGTIRKWLVAAGLKNIERIDLDSTRWVFVAS